MFHIKPTTTRDNFNFRKRFHQKYDYYTNERKKLTFTYCSPYLNDIIDQHFHILAFRELELNSS